ncbi:DAZ-associated protein 2 [Brienomyrus brachyistius]|uniref:DAZ-associated protein 2 n=1 Tax=Brienomyrus brachyistius TaxID=42636 RepID=UPI0020B17E63|nr:DAZ-associated protein 2 [Brienomyrus brachyistius]
MNNKASYPQQAVYPPQPGTALYPPGMQVSPQAPPYSEAPPSYSEIYQPRYMHAPQAPGQLPHISAAYPSTQMFVPLPQTLPMGPMSHTIPMAYYPVGALYPPGSTVLVDGGFDAGARFGPGGSATLPAPPPGHLPNAAQLAAMHGANLVMAQRKNNFFLGGSNGGYTIW